MPDDILNITTMSIGKDLMLSPPSLRRQDTEYSANHFQNVAWKWAWVLFSECFSRKVTLNQRSQSSVMTRSPVPSMPKWQPLWRCDHDLVFEWNLTCYTGSLGDSWEQYHYTRYGVIELFIPQLACFALSFSLWASALRSSSRSMSNFPLLLQLRYLLPPFMRFHSKFEGEIDVIHEGARMFEQRHFHQEQW